MGEPRARPGPSRAFGTTAATPDLTPSANSSRWDFIVLAPNPWLGQWVNRQQLFSRIGRQHNVLYSTGGLYIWERGSEAWQQASWTGSARMHDNVWVDEPARALPRWPRLAWLDQAAMALQVGRWRRRIGAGSGRPLVAYLFHPQFEPYARHLKADLTVYHAYDKYDDAPNWSPELEAAERRLAQQSDLVIASSEAMVEGLARKGAKAPRVLHNGADVAAFGAAADSKQPEPADLARIPHPRIGWVGSLHPHVDYAMLAEVARREPTWQFVIVGGVSPQRDAQADADRERCHAMPNIHFLGPKPAAEVPAYSARMDVNMLCYVVRTWIEAIFPLKLFEYFACGHPVVSADVPAVRPYADLLRIARSTDEWHLAIREALDGRSPGSAAQRRQLAGQNSWDHRVTTLSGWIQQCLSASARG